MTSPQNILLRHLGFLISLLFLFILCQQKASAADVPFSRFIQKDSITIRFLDGLSAIPFQGLPVIIIQGSDTSRILTSSQGEIHLSPKQAHLYLQTEQGKVNYWVRGETSGDDLLIQNEKGKQLGAFSFPVDHTADVYILREGRNEIASIQTLPDHPLLSQTIQKEKEATESKSAKKEEKKRVEKDAKPKAVISPVVDSIPIKNEITASLSVKNEKIYKVQILTSGKNLDPSDPIFKGVQGVETYTDQGIYKFTVGSFASMDACIRMQNEMRDKGFKGAFVVVFMDGKRIR